MRNLAKIRISVDELCQFMNMPEDTRIINAEIDPKSLDDIVLTVSNPALRQLEENEPIGFVMPYTQWNWNQK